MFSIRYTLIRPVLAVLTLLFLSAAVLVATTTLGLVVLIALTVMTFLSWINPPGVFGWLMQGACPHCSGHVVWEINQLPEPYHEVITVRCESCGRSKVVFSYQPH